MRRKIYELKEADKGGMIFQPKPRSPRGGVHELDFTSFYPSIIVNYNLSPEMLDGSKRRGFLSSVIEPLLDLRLKTKRLKKVDARYSGFDSILKLDAGHMLWLYRLQECQVWSDRGP